MFSVWAGARMDLHFARYSVCQDVMKNRLVVMVQGPVGWLADTIFGLSVDRMRKR